MAGITRFVLISPIPTTAQLSLLARAVIQRLADFLRQFRA
jgi:hypothetical protein